MRNKKKVIKNCLVFGLNNLGRSWITFWCVQNVFRTFFVIILNTWRDVHQNKRLIFFSLQIFKYVFYVLFNKHKNYAYMNTCTVNIITLNCSTWGSRTWWFTKRRFEFWVGDSFYILRIFYSFSVEFSPVLSTEKRLPSENVTLEKVPEPFNFIGCFSLSVLEI